MSSTRVCPICSAPLAADAPQGLCPQCLLKAALSGQSAADTAITGAWNSGAGAATIPPSAGVKLRYVGDYELLEEIARGGMGIVWRAKQISLNRTVAVKTIRDGALASPDDVQRFRREAEAAANLQHPNIVAIHEVGEHHGQYYFSMDYVAGRDLAAIRRDGPLPPQQIAKLVQTIAETIHFAHQRGTFHRDLKPQNILLDESGEPHITDFGLAKLTGEDSGLTQTGVVMGSPSYMPPEQAAGNLAEFGPHSDVYSLGAILYELLTDRPPFQGASPIATLRAVMELEPTPPHKLAAAVPPDLETICLKCLEKSPSLRYPTARELADDLGRFLNQEPILARRASVVRRASSWIRRHPGVLGLLATVAIAGLAFVGVYLYEENRFLRAQHANPNLVREAGDRTASLKEFESNFGMLYLVALIVAVSISVNKRRVPWRDALEPYTRFRPAEPMTEGWRLFAIFAGLFFIGCGLYWAMRWIEVLVWERTATSSRYFWTFGALWFGSWCISRAIRDQRLADYGRPMRQITQQQTDSIQTSLNEGDTVGAIRRFRNAHPDATLEEAIYYVRQLASKMNVEVFTPKPLRRKDVAWKTFWICAAVEFALIGVALLAIPPLRANWVVPANIVSGLICGFGLTLLRRQSGESRWWLVWAVVLPLPIFFGVTNLLVSALDPSLSKADHKFAIYAFVVAICMGSLLFLSAIPRRHRSSDS